MVKFQYDMKPLTIGKLTCNRLNQVSTTSNNKDVLSTE